MRKMLCFDMDGTIADLYNVTNWLDKIHNEDATPFVEAQPLYDMNELHNLLVILKKQGWEIRIITWLAMNSTKAYEKKVTIAKKQWLAHHHFPMDKATFLTYGTKKDNCIKAIADYAILFDDNDEIRNNWDMGKAINPITENIIEVLKRLIV